MGYRLGIDLGTTYTAAAVYRDGRVEVVGLGGRAPSVPSVLLLRDDEEVLVGEAATRRAMTEPERVAREFKRRVGDPTPLLLGGTPYSAEALSAKVLRWVVDRVAELEGGPPDRITVTHPANWGPYKQDLLAQAIRMAELGEVDTLTEPEAAAIAYAHNERVEPGSLLAVYDLGGGTFDAAVLRKTGDGFEILGEPEGIERLGGIDFDEAVFAHVNRSLDGALDELDPDDSTVLAALARLRQECVEAKEALSSDTDVSIPVLLPGLQTEVRLTRTELEALVRPTLAETIGALRRALQSAEVEPDHVDAVLLVGGSSRVPLISQLVSAELGQPVAVDAHPKHAIATGAALASGAASEPPDRASEPSDAAAETPTTGGQPAASQAATRGEPASGVPATATEPTQPLPPPTGGDGDGTADGDHASGASRRLVPLVAGALALVLVGGGAAVALLGGDADPDDDEALVTAEGDMDHTAEEPDEPGRDEADRGDRNGVDEGADDGVESSAAPDEAEPAEADAHDEPDHDHDEAAGEDEAEDETHEQDESEVPPDHDVPPDTDYALITGISVQQGDDGEHYAVEFETFEYEPELPGQHVHFFFDTVPPEEAGVPGDGPWILYGGGSPFTEYTPADRPEMAEQMCALVANEDHSVIADSGNCYPLPD